VSSNAASDPSADEGPTHSVNWPGSLPQLMSCRVKARSASVNVKRTVRFSPFLRLIFSKPFSSLTGRVTDPTRSLHDLLAVARAAVGYRHGRGQFLTRADFRLVERDRRIGEAGVAEAITERIERRVRRIEITRDIFGIRILGLDRPPGVFHVVMDRHLPDVSWEGHRQFARRVVIAIEDVGDRMAAHRPRIPGFQDGIDIGVGPLDAVRAPAHQHEDDRLAGLLQLFQQRLLVARQVERGAARRFAGHVPMLAHRGDDDVRFLRQRDRLGKTVTLARVGELIARALGIGNRCPLGRAGLHAL